MYNYIIAGLKCPRSVSLETVVQELPRRRTTVGSGQLHVQWRDLRDGSGQTGDHGAAHRHVDTGLQGVGARGDAPRRG